MKLIVLSIVVDLLLVNAVRVNEFDDNIIGIIGEDVLKNNGTFSDECSRDIGRVFSAWPESWAFQMIDSRGKIPSGLLYGNLISLGQFDQCLAVHKEFNDATIRGKYCLAKIPIDSILEGFKAPKHLPMIRQENVTNRLNPVNYDKLGRLSFVFGLCIPESCSGVNILNLIQSNPDNRVLPQINIYEDECSTVEGEPITAAGWVAISLLIVFALLLAASTIYDVATSHTESVYKNHDVFIAFSLKTNTRRLLTINKNSGNIKCIHGVRTLSMFWVILGHRYFINLTAPSWSINEVYDWVVQMPSMILLGATVSVDTFLLLSGLLLTYVFLKQMEKEKTFNLLKFYLHRHLRLTPTFAVMIFLTAALTKNLATGPVYGSIMNYNAETCQKYWWTALLYVHNYAFPGFICIGQTWYLAVDMQLYYFSPLILLPLYKNAKYGLINLGFWIVTFLTVLLAIVYSNNWTAATAALIPGSEDRVASYYLPTHTRALPWFIGVGVGYLIYKSSKTQVKMSKLVLILGWMSCFVIMLAVVFGMKPLQDPEHVVNKLEDSTYDAFARIGWVLAVSWMIFACIHGYGGLINDILSLKIWEILGRLSYCMFLVHLPLQGWQNSQMRIVPNFSNVNYIHLFFGDIFITILISYVISMMFEAPVLALEKKIFGRNNNKKKIEEEIPQVKIQPQTIQT